MKKNKSQKSFLDIMYNFVFRLGFGFLIIFMIGMIVLVWFFGMKPRSVRTWFSDFENYYNQTQDPRYEWTQQR